MHFVKAASDVYVGPVPSEHDLAALAREGVHTVIDLREPSERRGPLDGPGLAAKLGLAYVNIPVHPATLSDREVEQLQAAMAEKRRGYVVHCAMGPRAEALYIAKAALDHGWGPVEAGREADRLGFQYGGSPRLRGFVTDFVTRHGPVDSRAAER